jgi:dienelactone hydrolase
MSCFKLLGRVILTLVGLGLLVVVAFVLLVLVGRNKTVVLPTPSGPYAVGRVSFDWVDDSRVETFAQDQNAKRELMVWLWYPAEPVPGAVPAEYLPANWKQARQQDQGLGSLLLQRIDAIRVHAVTDAPVSPAESSYPALILSPGYGPLPTDYTSLAEDLASHGYLVAGIANTYSASVVVFPDGRVVRRVPEASIPETSAEAGKQAADRLVMVWAADVVSVINRLEKLNADTNGKFCGRLDLNRLGIFGHSFGGAASAQACLLDDRCKAGIDLDGTLFGDVVQKGVKQPFMFITSEPISPELDEQDRRSFKSSLENGAVWIMIKGSRHFNFTDLSVIFAPALKVLMLGSIDGQRGLKITSDYIRLFFDQYLSQVDTPLLRGSSPDYPEVQFRLP